MKQLWSHSKSQMILVILTCFLAILVFGVHTKPSTQIVLSTEPVNVISREAPQEERTNTMEGVVASLSSTSVKYEIHIPQGFTARDSSGTITLTNAAGEVVLRVTSYRSNNLSSVWNSMKLAPGEHPQALAMIETPVLPNASKEVGYGDGSRVWILARYAETPSFTYSLVFNKTNTPAMLAAMSFVPTVK